MSPIGGVSGIVVVWSKRPTPHRGYHPYGVWWAQADRTYDHLEETLHQDTCRERFGTVPDNDEQLIRVGRVYLV